MKIVLIAAMMIFSMGECSSAQTIPTTPNLGLPLIPDGYTNWGVPYRSAMTTIDSKVAPLLSPHFTGTATAVNLAITGTCTGCGGAVSSVFGRSGAVTAQTGDYSFSQISGLLNLATQATGSAATASALATTPTLCSTGNAPTGILANGNATGCAPIGGGSEISGLTSGFIPLAGSATTLTANAHLDDGVTTAATITATEPIVVSSSGASQLSFTYNGTPLVPGSSTTAVIGVNSSGQAVVSEAAGSASRICTAANGVCVISGIANIQITLPTSSISANSCTTPATATMTGVLTTSAFDTAFATNPNAVTGWGSTGGLTFTAWPTANTLNWSVCNQTASPITPGAMTLNVGAR